MKITVYGNRAGHNFRFVGGELPRLYIYLPFGREMAIRFGGVR